ncbi:hypothetical protein IB234_11735 [Pseudomonas sp. PDM16]|uniref:hypothetical protein n=1 Tax=Pseudomonas sp. PDM16 TaxID=2769292 RepID=UPI001781BDB0|nr:hypothetical protein [Pseudomonas sp. PDM16]MBD9415225.1 hypothetical protein [Pseudomonas sp. PDM16]
MNNAHDHPAYQEGRKRYFSNKGKYENPYPPGSLEHDIFERGWSQALKRTPEITIREAKKTQTQKMHEEAAKELKRNKAKEAYLKSKGD